MSLLLSFDIGHSSIGWGVLSTTKKWGDDPDIMGCGSVTFPKDDCLASARRRHRRTRRNIRSTRLRIARMKALFLQLGVLSKEELNSQGHPAPFALAAKVLISEKPILSWLELWHVLRWYAHNRGYDGNSRWARDEAAADDTEKERVALELMEKHGTIGKSMAETVCAVLGINLASKKISSAKPYKTLNAAFPRKIVRNEVLQILNKHLGHLDKLDEGVISTLIAPDNGEQHKAWRNVHVNGLELPKRYFGGLLFGQLIPRFDNRIIGRCPISGDKIPNKSTHEFLEYRWAMILANLRVDGQPLTIELRNHLHEAMQLKGRMTAVELRKTLVEVSGSTVNNVEGYFELHPDSADALVLDPAFALYSGVGPGAEALKPYWNTLPDQARKRALGRWKKGRTVSLSWMQQQCPLEASESFNEILQKAFNSDQKSKKSNYLTYAHFLNQSFAPAGLSGRAPYSRKVMKQTVEFVLTTNRHPTEKGTDTVEAGPLYRSKKVKAEERSENISSLTNNHLIRQRLDILIRLVDDILAEYADGDARKVSDIVVEVASDLQTYSGLTSKEMQGELTKRLSHFKAAVTELEKKAPNLEITGSLIRKCRIAMDMNWICPFTEKEYGAHQLKYMEREHIIPYADRPTNSLDALVLTFPEVNKMKGKRTACAFVKEFQSAEVKGAPDLSITTIARYKALVKKLKPKARMKETYPEDYRRQSNRVKWLLLEDYESKEHGFTAGALTQTSHLNRLSARQLETRFIDSLTQEPSVRIHSLPGQITAETRKAWKLLGTLAKACPQVQESSGETKTKTQIRDITHLHHALDAVAVALVSVYLPGSLPGQIENEKGALWAAMLKRNKTKADIDLLMRTGMFAKHYQKQDSAEDEKKLDVHLCDIPKSVKEKLAERLAEKRVVQHIPSDQSGALLEETTWRYVCEYQGQAIMVQKISRDSRTQDTEKATFGWEDLPLKKSYAKLLKIPEIHKALTNHQKKLIQRGLMKLESEPIRKVVGLEAGKLSQNKAVRVIAGNFGITLGKRPHVITFHGVSKQLKKAKQDNGGQMPEIVRQGSIIVVKGGTWHGVWRVTSVKDSKAYGVSVDLEHPHLMGLAKGNAKIPKMIEEGLQVLKPSLTGENFSAFDC
jgi:CRISPR-associated endonuclease Csn1